ncbi:MAG TPA: hypothetical protein PLZ81_11645 [Acidiphilium rubrum]|nr:hypothetical protein [Acidiphilium rubrum]
MRTLLMAGSALMLMSGIAFAQNAPASTTGGQPATAGMNSTGVTGKEPGTSSGNMSATAGGMAAPDAAGTAKSTTGMQTMPKQRRSTMSKTMGHSTGMMHHSAMMNHGMAGGGMMPENGSAGQYMHMAQQAVMAHNKTRATDALGRAETDLLTNSYAQGSVNGPISTPAISAIRDARKAVRDGDYHGASMMIHKAMMDMHGGMMNKGGMGSTMNTPVSMSNTGMGNGSMNNGAMNNGAMGNGAMGNGAMGSNAQPGPGAAQGKKDSTMHKQMTNSSM